MSSPLPILHCDNHVLVVNKPPGLITQGASQDEASVHRMMSEYIKHTYQKPGNVYLGIVSRLDAATSGIVVLARTSKAASRLSEQFRNRTVDKHYLAIVVGTPIRKEVGWITWKDRVEKNEQLERMVIVAGTSHRDNTIERGQAAELRARTLAFNRERSLLQIQLETGRKHQIRIQASSRDAPIVGDRKYGGPPWHPQQIALHAFHLSFEHPTLKSKLQFTVPPPLRWQELGIEMPPLQQLESLVNSDKK